jgi:hypothetical protein
MLYQEFQLWLQFPQTFYKNRIKPLPIAKLCKPLSPLSQYPMDAFLHSHLYQQVLYIIIRYTKAAIFFTVKTAVLPL